MLKRGVKETERKKKIKGGMEDRRKNEAGKQELIGGGEWRRKEGEGKTEC